MSSVNGAVARDTPLGPLNDTFKFFVANMDFSTSALDIRAFFSSFGTVNFVKVIQDNRTKRSKGYGFLYMYDAGGDAAVENFANAHQNRITLLGKSRVFLARHDQKRALPMRNPGRSSHDGDLPKVPGYPQGSHYGPSSQYTGGSAYSMAQPVVGIPPSSYGPNHATPHSAYVPPAPSPYAPPTTTTTAAAPQRTAVYGAAPYAPSPPMTTAHPPPAPTPGGYDYRGAYPTTSGGGYTAPPPPPTDPNTGYAAATISVQAATGGYAPAPVIPYLPPPQQQVTQPTMQQPQYAAYSTPQQQQQPPPPMVNAAYSAPQQALPPPPPQPNNNNNNNNNPLSTKLLIQNLPVDVMPKDVVQALSKHSLSVRRCTMEYDPDPNASWCFAHVDMTTAQDASQCLALAQQSLLRCQSRVLLALADTHPPPDGVHIPVGMGAPISSGPRPAPRSDRRKGKGRGGGANRGGGPSRDRRRDKPY